MFAFLWILLSFCFYFYIFTHYLFLPFSGENLLATILAWGLLVWLIFYTKTQIRQSKAAKYGYGIALAYFIMLILHMVASLLILFYAKEVIFDYAWAKIAIGMLGIPIGGCCYHYWKK